MASKPFTSETVVDAIATLESGVDSGVAPMLLKANQLSFGTNISVRGAYASHRPPFAEQYLEYGGNYDVQETVEGGLFQGAAYYKPDNVAVSQYVVQPWITPIEQIVASISGRLFLFTPDTLLTKVWHVTEVTVPGDPNDSTAPQAWLWQAEKWMIITDGTTKMPIYFDGTSSRRSIGNDADALTIATGDTTYPGLNGLFHITLLGYPDHVWAQGTPISGIEIGEYVVHALGGNINQYVLKRTSMRGPATGDTVTHPQHIYPEMPAGRLGTYGMGRVWLSLIDGKQFIGGDIIGGPAGTEVEGYRDAVLHTSENSIIANGGAFSTPGAHGDIRAMIFCSTLDVSLGKGPMQVLTPTSAFSCYAPTDRSTWNIVTNPILTQSLISNGAESYYGTVQANGDIIFRSVDGIRSLILGRRDFATWGNVPASSEMDRVLSLDNPAYLRYVSSIIFDNRLLMTCAPNSFTGRGVFFTGIIALNFDPLANLRGKMPAVYDGLWTGLNAFQLVVGRFGGVERAFAFTTIYDPEGGTTGPTKLHEILPTPKDVYSPINLLEETNWRPDDEVYDNGYTRIVWTGETGTIFKGQNLQSQEFHRLIDGEILVDNLQGNVDYAVYYRPDEYPCWVEWHKWTECAAKDSSTSKAQYRPRMGFGEPSYKPCDPSTKRALREGYTFQFKFIIQGHCRFLGARFKAITLPIPTFAAPVCSPPTTDTYVNEQ
jgi:hypothetical protein